MGPSDSFDVPESRTSSDTGFVPKHPVAECADAVSHRGRRPGHLRIVVVYSVAGGAGKELLKVDEASGNLGGS